MRELTEAELRERLAMCGRLIYDDVEIPIPRDARPAWHHDHPQYTQDGDQNIWAPCDVAANVDDASESASERTSTRVGTPVILR